MTLQDELSCEGVIISGLVIILIGGALRYMASRRPSKPDPMAPDLPGPTGGDRNSYIFLLFGAFWTAFGVFRCVT